jgi:hypothetical protein
VSLAVVLAQAPNRQFVTLFPQLERFDDPDSAKGAVQRLEEREIGGLDERGHGGSGVNRKLTMASL